jgi:hypothetical protein
MYNIYRNNCYSLTNIVKHDSVKSSTYFLFWLIDTAVVFGNPIYFVHAVFIIEDFIQILIWDGAIPPLDSRFLLSETRQVSFLTSEYKPSGRNCTISHSSPWLIIISILQWYVPSIGENRSYLFIPKYTQEVMQLTWSLYSLSKYCKIHVDVQWNLYNPTPFPTFCDIQQKKLWSQSISVN